MTTNWILDNYSEDVETRQSGELAADAYEVRDNYIDRTKCVLERHQFADAVYSSIVGTFSATLTAYERGVETTYNPPAGTQWKCISDTRTSEPGTTWYKRAQRWEAISAWGTAYTTPQAPV